MNCKECGKCSNKSTHRTQVEKNKITKRLNVIEGQVRGINQMVLDDRYCDDILIQIAAVTKSLQTLGNSILESHMRNCVVRDIKSGNTDIINDVMQLVKKLQ